MGDIKAFSVLGAAGNTYRWKLTLPDNSVQILSSSTSSSGNITFAITGTYILWVQATDAFGCLSEPLVRNIIVQPNNSKILFTNSTSSACYQAANDFTIPVQFKDGSGVQLSASHFPMVVSFTVNGVTQPTQTIAFANQVLAISGSSFAANSSSDTPVVITITGATDALKLTVQPETISGQNIHTHTIFRALTTPTVVSQTTNNTTPAISGTATVGPNETFSVLVNGFKYIPGDGNLIVSGTNWTLTIPAARALTNGTYQVIATVANANCSLTDNTSNELIINTTAPTVPTVNSQTTANPTPVITGTAVLASGETFTVTVNNFTYTPGDGHLTLTGTNWSLQIPAGSELTDGTYQVIAKVTDAAGSSSTDTTTNELIINTQAVVLGRLATNDVNITFRNTPVTGNVLINDAGFFGSNPIVAMYLTPVNGTINMAANGQYTYTPKKDFTGTDNFYYTVSTLEKPPGRDTVNVTIQVLPDVLSQIPPVANDDELKALMNTAISGNVLVNDLSVSGEQIIVNTKPKSGPTSGTLLLNSSGSFVYTPKPGFVGTDQFVYEIYGAVSGLTAQARVTITVSSDQPEVRLFADDDLFFSYGKTIQGNLLANDSYPSISTLKVTQTPVVQVAHGTVSIGSNGLFSYTPEAGFVGTDQFVYELCDTKLNQCVKATVFILNKETPALFADLSIVKTGPVSTIPGEQVSYQLTLTNLGTATADKILISDYLPAAIENPKFNLAGSTTLNDWPGYYELATLEVNKPFSLFISGNVAANAPDSLKNVATVTSLTWDPKMENNISVLKTPVRRGPVARISGAPALTVGSCNPHGQLLDASKSGGNGLTFSWSPTIYLDDATSSSPLCRPGKTTRYLLTVTDINGLKDTSSVLVTLLPAPKAVTDKNVFVAAPNETILLNGSNSTGTGLTSLWLTKEGIILNGGTTAMAQVSGLGMYYLNVTDQMGCINKDSVNVGLYIQAISDTAKTNVNESVTINVLRNDIPAGKINPSSISIVTPPLHGIASVSADSLILYLPEDSYIGQDEFIYAICDYFRNCDQAKVLVFINDIPFFIPEAFSPNGDGINDKFEILGLAKYKTVAIEIFNRWGNIVYQSNNYGEGKGKDGFWDGTIKSGLRIGSGPVPSGTYFYILKLNGKENINGSIYVDR